MSPDSPRVSVSSLVPSVSFSSSSSSGPPDSSGASVSSLSGSSGASVSSCSSSGAASMISVLLGDDERFLQHVAPPEHPERGERLVAVRAGLERALAAVGPGHVYAPLPLIDASDEQLA